MYHRQEWPFFHSLSKPHKGNVHKHFFVAKYFFGQQCFRMIAWKRLW